MIRFIDIRGQGTYCRFSWWNTTTSRFESHDGAMAWDTWHDFASDYTGTELDRYRNLAPAWVYMPALRSEEACFENNLPNPYGGPEWTLSTLGLNTGLVDRNGTPVHLGDVLEFDPTVFGGENRWMAVVEDGKLVTLGGLSEWSESVTIAQTYATRLECTDVYTRTPAWLTQWQRSVIETLADATKPAPEGTIRSVLQILDATHKTPGSHQSVHLQFAAAIRDGSYTNQQFWGEVLIGARGVPLARVQAFESDQLLE